MNRRLTKNFSHPIMCMGGRGLGPQLLLHTVTDLSLSRFSLLLFSKVTAHGCISHHNSSQLFPEFGPFRERVCAITVDDMSGVGVLLFSPGKAS